MDKISHPLPHFSEAAKAAKAYLDAQREHLMLTAEVRARREGKRAGYLAGAAVTALFALAFFFFWVTIQIHETGAPAWTLALGCLAIFGGLAFLLLELSKSAIHVADADRIDLRDENEEAA